MGADPQAGDALGTAEQTPGQHQGSCLMDTEPVTLHELHPANHRTVGRVDLMNFHPLAIAAGEEISLGLAVAEG